MFPRPRRDTTDGFDPREVERDIKRQLALIDHRVPRHIEVRVREIATTITDVLPRAAELGPTSRDLFILQRTADDYLPTALQTYLNLPRGAMVPGGKTADQVLTEQLDVLASRIYEVKDAIQRKDSDALVAHGRFLEEKFGSGALRLPGTRPSSPRRVATGPTGALARTNPMAWVSLGFGVFGIFGHVVPVVGGVTCAIVAIVTGFVARSQIRRTGEGGARLALFGIILGVVHLVVVALLLVLFGTVLIALIHSIFH
jgi:Domain of unknown function (DUF4190)